MYDGTFVGHTCPSPLITPLIAGQIIEAGTVTISNDNEYLYIRVNTTAPWLIKLIHIYVGTDPVEKNGGGNFKPGQFPFPQPYNEPYPSTHQLQIKDCQALKTIFHTE